MFKIYSTRLVFRITVFVMMLLIYFRDRSDLLISNGLSLARGLRPLHVLWLILAVEMAQKFFPRSIVSMGCRKQFKSNYAPSAHKPDRAEIVAWIRGEDGAAQKVFILWFGVNALLAVFYWLRIIGESELVLLSLLYYVCDLICVLFYCPFQSLIMKNRCCVTCRIFNWDSMMIITPLIFVRSLFSWSLALVALLVLCRWEYVYRRHPQRFSEASNENLRCQHCQERICMMKRSLHFQ